MRRVVVTGIGVLTPLGSNWGQVLDAVQRQHSGVAPYGEWLEYEGLRSKLAGAVEMPKIPEHYGRKQLRSMSRSSLMAVLASEWALSDAGLRESEELASQRVGIAYGSCLGGSDALLKVAGACVNKKLRGIPASTYVQVMSHSAASSISMFFGINGRIIPTSSACTSASQAIGYSYECIKAGHQDVMLAGGCEELCAGLVGLFDSMCATSTQSSGDLAPRPFDSNRDGLVLSEGAGTLVLEEYEHAHLRGAKILAEVVGFGTNTDACHITNPTSHRMAETLRLALRSADLEAADVDLVHAHATATELGDIAESQAVKSIFAQTVPVTAMKSYIGHTLGGAGAIESWAAIEMMRSQSIIPIRNLENIDSRCAELDYVQTAPRAKTISTVMVNNFAFGGVNTSLIYQKP